MFRLDEKLEKHFLPFNESKGVSGKYCYWTINENLNKCPIVLVTNDNKIYPVSKNIKQLLQLMSYNNEIKIQGDTVSFSKGLKIEDEHSNLFVKLLKNKFKFNLIENDKEAKKIVKAANDKYSLKIKELGLD